MKFVTNKINDKRPYGFKYFPNTGRFERSIRNTFDSRGKIGHIHRKNRKYQRIMFLGKEYALHRLAFNMMNVHLPQGKIGGVGIVVDHINGNTSDNRFSNLRILSKRENDQNKKRHRDGKLCGIRRSKKTKVEKWEARIVINKKLIHIGTYSSKEDAHDAYLRAVREHDAKMVTPQ